LLISRFLSLAAATAVCALCFQSEEPQEKPKTPAKLTLKAERSVEFDTDEGTWISLDVSLDGKTMAFELLGDIYTMPINGGKATPLLTGTAMETQPRFSPDGKEIVFLSDRDGADDQESRATRDLLPGYAFTPDSEAVIASYGGHIWRVPLNGSPQQIPFDAHVKQDIGPLLDFPIRVTDSEPVRSRLIMEHRLHRTANRLLFRVWLQFQPSKEAGKNLSTS